LYNVASCWLYLQEHLSDYLYRLTITSLHKYKLYYLK
jgi:hypothetical protein